MPKIKKELQNLPKVRSNLPNSLKGNIREVLTKNPTLEEKRKVITAINSRNNFFAFKNGKKMQRNFREMSCNTCPVAKRCPHFQKPQTKEQTILCAFDPIFSKHFKAKNFDIRDEEIVKDALNELVKGLAYKIGRGCFFENLDGGVLDKKVTALTRILCDILMRLKR